MKNNNWSIKISSTIENNYNLSEKDIMDAIYSINDEFIINWKKESDEKTLKMYPYPIAKWQLNKGKEFRNKFIEGLSIDYNNTNITVKTDYSIELPNDWDRGDLIEWSEGFNRLNKEYLFLSVENLSKLPVVDGKHIGYDGGLNKIKETNRFFDDLRKNQKFVTSMFSVED